MKKLYSLLKIFSVIAFLSIAYAQNAYATEETSKSLGDIANNMLQPMMIATDLLYFTYLVIGFGFVTASVIKFFERRINPLGVRVSQIAFLFIAGLIMLVAPYYLTHSDAGYTASTYPSILNS